MTAIRLGATRSALYETWQHPELIVIGRSRATSHAMLKTFADDIELNCEPDLSDMNLLIGMKCHYIEVNPRYYSDYVDSHSGTTANDILAAPNRLAEQRWPVPVGCGCP